MIDRDQAGADDIAIMGGGMAGLSAALTAAQMGARVSVYEADTAPGGSARWSSGRIWSVDDYAQMRTLIPGGDARLQKTLSDLFEVSVDWLAASVDDLAPQAPDKVGRGRIMQRGAVGDRTAFFAVFADRCEAAGVRLHFGAHIARLDRASLDGTPGFEVDFSQYGVQHRGRARSVVIATGGFQANAELRARHIGPEAAGLMVRSNPNAQGTGLEAGLGLGGTTSRATSWFYGKSMPPGAGRLDPSQYKSLTYDFARQAIAVNLEGRRFVTEATGISGEAIANAGVMQPGGTYFLLVDDCLSDRVDEKALSRLAKQIGSAGGPLMLSAPECRELAEIMQRYWAVCASQLTETLEHLNDAVTFGQSHRLAPAYDGPGLGLAGGSCHALICHPAITQTLGGLWVDDTMALLDSEGARIAGIFVAGADAGGVYAGCYGGGLSWALVSGRRAGLAASQFTASYPTRSMENPNLSTEPSL